MKKYCILEIPTGQYFCLEKETLNEVLDSIMMLPDGDLANYEIFEQIM